MMIVELRCPSVFEKRCRFQICRVFRSRQAHYRDRAGCIHVTSRPECESLVDLARITAWSQ